MNPNNECELLRKRFHELLIEQETAPHDLIAMWESHKSWCKECLTMFEQLYAEQMCAEKRLSQLFEYIPQKVERISFARKQQRRTPIFLIAAASLLICLIIGILMYQYRGHNQDAESLDKIKIASALKLAQEKRGKEINKQELSDMVNDIFVHIQKMRQEFYGLRNLVTAYKNTSLGQKIPFLGFRLNLNCRLVLMSPDSLNELSDLELQGYCVAEVEKVFAVPINKIGSDKESKIFLTRFFQQASPHLLNILRYRHTLLNKIIKIFGEEKETLNFIENLVCDLILKGDPYEV